ncbi:MAG: PAS domain S-box protein [Candidatus Omnitrophota bacterium]
MKNMAYKITGLFIVAMYVFAAELIAARVTEVTVQRLGMSGLSGGTFHAAVLAVLVVPFIFFLYMRPGAVRSKGAARELEMLRESEERFRGAFETSAIGIALVSPEGKWLKVNNTLCEIVGYTEEELLTKTFQDITHPDDLDADLAHVRQMLDNKIRHYRMEKRYFHKDGRVVWILLSVSLVRDAGGKPLYFVAQIEDISDRKAYSAELEKINDKLRASMNKIQERDQRLLDTSEELKSEKIRLDTIIRQMGEGVIVINEKKEIELINNRAKEILGYGPHEEIPVGYRKFFILRLWKELEGTGERIVKKEIELQRPREAVLLVVLARLALSSRNEGFVAVMRDITFEKRMEKMKSDFVANVSHEIRSPMVPMKDSLSLLLDESAGPINDQQRKFLAILKNNVDRLLRLVNDLLDMSKIEAGKMELKEEPLNLPALVKETAESVRVYAARKNITLAIESEEGLPVVTCDRDRITQVIINIVMNAFKFAPEGGRVEVSCKAYLKKNGNSYVMVSVKDNGPGIKQDEAMALFDRFKQIAMPERVQGTGLGLAISKAIIEMHKGAIWVESEPGRGSAFNFILPQRR